MPLINCHECNKEISDSAKTCPHCGAPTKMPQPKMKKRKTGFFTWFIVGILSLLFISAIYNGYSARQAEVEKNKAEQDRIAMLTPEQRTAEAAAKKAAAKAQAESDAKAVKEKAAGEDMALAEATCQLAIEHAANDPDSVSWIREERRFGYTNKDQTEAASEQPFRAKNGFGATTRHTAVCKLKKIDGQWQIVKIGEL